MNWKNSSLDLEMLMAVSEFDSEDKLLWEKFSVVLSLIPRINALLKENFSEERLIHPIVMKKMEHLKSATTKAQLKLISAPPKVRYHGNGKILPENEFVIPEEELICWSYASSLGPLNDAAFNRYLELFTAIFPEQVAELGL